MGIVKLQKSEQKEGKILFFKRGYKEIGEAIVRMKINERLI